MSGLLPIIEQLAAAAHHADRANWLLRCPLDILGRYDGTIRNRLMHAGFPAGIGYLDELRTVKCAVRREDGQLSLAQTDMLSDAAERLRAAAHGWNVLETPGGVTDL
ncbi:hypothetical protein [Rhizobium sp. PL01]|uniref:hypothetical protein n=1 Tax=Rhizobium sp. PL01 TaxID=3085631 RepID=UPI0029812A2C|nr:hypothetical protein [Rhizobium sp. PL01]MDW5313747.1 hypothetical protein [Rhizobium sp. PL01]